MPPSAMASTRRAQPVHIYQDPTTRYDDTDVEAALLQALGPVNDASPRRNFLLEPSTTLSSATSPRKSARQSSSPRGASGLQSVSIPAPRQPVFTTDSPKKNAAYYTHSPHPPLKQAPRQAMFNTFAAAHGLDKENESVSYDQHAMQYDDDESMYGSKQPLKRSLMDAAPLKDRSQSNKRPKTEDAPDACATPQPEEMPVIEDDGTKPSHSYATLIGMAIMRSPNRRLTLAQIYKWISDHFKFYKGHDAGWQNSIRHNLSLNKAFIKQERPKDDPGKGNYWAIEPGMEKQFFKDRVVRKILPGGGENPQFMQAMQHDLGSMSRSSSAPAIGHFTLGPNLAKKFEPKAIDSSRFPVDEPFSSDGTLPASDPALQDDEQQDALAMPPPASRHMRSSPPPADITSSPPPMISESIRQGTPPALPRFSSASRSPSHKRKFAPLNDSGYYSSIESSVVRGPGYAHIVPTSEADHERHRMKRGRAEEEIARIRSSSYDSPTKDKLNSRKPSVHFEASSPHRSTTSIGLPPLTPAVVFKRPARPPPSISPNTNLRNHRNRIRKLLGDSPMKTLTPLRENDHSWSPHFNIDQENLISPVKASNMTPWRDALFNNAFDLFDYSNNDDLTSRGSPEKKRPKLERAVTSTGILAEITGSSSMRLNAATTMTAGQDSPFNNSFSPFKMTPSYVARTSAHLGSPLKRSSSTIPMPMPMPSFATAGDQAPDWLDLSLENLFGLQDGPAASAPTMHAAPSVPSSRTPKRVTAAAVNVHGHMQQQQQQQQQQHADFFFTGCELPQSDDGGSSEEGVDILQEFGKIGAQIGAQRHMVPVSGGAGMLQGSEIRRPARPAMGRSVTSRF